MCPSPTSITMADVAARAGVSKALVSIVFRGAPGASEENRARVLRAAAELDYRPDHRARLLGRGRSRTIGVVFGLHREFHGDLVEGLYAAGDATGWDMALGATGPSRAESVAVRGLLEQRCEAIVLLGPMLSRRDIEALAATVPVVVVARRVARSAAGPALDVVRTDDLAGAAIATQHLLELGHRSVVHVDGGRVSGAAERRRGYRRAMSEAGLAARETFVPGGIDEASGEGAASALVELLERPDAPTAVAAFNDHCALGMLSLLRSRGIRVPEDLSLVGFDDSQVAGLRSVSLTTVRQDAVRLAGDALSLAAARVEDPVAAPVERVVAPELVVRHTTEPPRR